MSEMVVAAFYEYDFALAMAKVAFRMTEGYEQQAAQQVAVESAEHALEHLREAEAPPDDLTARTTERVQAIKAQYEKQLAQAQEMLDLPAGTQEVFGVDVQQMQIVATTAIQWIAAIEGEGY